MTNAPHMESVLFVECLSCQISSNLQSHCRR
jgi:hypothetical protein